MYFYKDHEGEIAVKYARNVISEKLGANTAEKVTFTDKFKDKSGVFVTINEYPSMYLRGCIGIPEPLLALKDAIKDAAISAAFGDPRFSMLKKEELTEVTLEVSILTPPESIHVDIANPEKDIKIGRDGLILNFDGFSGLLLPQVAVEYYWNVKEFLEETGMKAGLDRRIWKDGRCVIKKFSAEIFEEIEPSGIVRRKILNEL